MAQSVPQLVVAAVPDLHGLNGQGGPASHERDIGAGLARAGTAAGPVALPACSPDLPFDSVDVPCPDETARLMVAALEAESAALADPDPATVFQEMLDAKLLFIGEACTPTRRLVALLRMDVPEARRKLNRIETAVLVRVLCGEQQKAAALDLDIACSTASKWCTEGLEKLRLESHRIPLPLVLAAQAWSSGRTLDVDARSIPFEHAGRSMLVLSTAAPLGRASGLTQAELEVAKLVIDGASRWEIGHARHTSAQTVACQLRGVYSKLRVRGRHDLIHHAEQAGWFH
jgi:DNA-binding NarL/FixJ family response regulator